MKKNPWSKRIGKCESAKRAGGRRRYNADRQRGMWERRFEILRLCARAYPLPRGAQQLLAERFGVDKGVISRDLAWVRKTGLAGLHEVFPGAVIHSSFKRGVVTVEWSYTAPPVSYAKLERMLKTAQRLGTI